MYESVNVEPDVVLEEMEDEYENEQEDEQEEKSQQEYITKPVKSMTWSYYNRINDLKYQCKKCHKLIRIGVKNSTSNLNRHLKAMHDYDV